MYTFERFVDEIATNITQYLPEEYKDAEPKTEPVAMDTDRLLFIPENKPGITPCISLKYYYEAYTKGIPFNNIMILIAKDREKLKPEIDTYTALSMPYIKTHLIMRLLPIKTGLPGIIMGDVKLTFCLLYESSNPELQKEVSISGVTPGFIEIPLTEKALYTLDLTPEKLYHIAMKNELFNNRYKVEGLKQMIKSTLGADALLDIEDDGDNGQLSITTERMYYDAAGIFAPKVQEEIIKRIGRNYYIAIPTLHIAIAMQKGEVPENEMKGVIKMSYEASPIHDRLSDKLYTMKNGKLIEV